MLKGLILCVPVDKRMKEVCVKAIGFLIVNKTFKIIIFFFFKIQSENYSKLEEFSAFE